MIELETRVVEVFSDYFKNDPEWIVRSPGRVNIIGEHTDYNDGFVLPMTIDRGIYIAGISNNSDRVECYSIDYEMHESFTLEEISQLKSNKAKWFDYIKGMIWALNSAGYPLAGWSGVIAGNIPIGAGLSSSAALELAIARTCQTVSKFTWNETKMALLG